MPDGNSPATIMEITMFKLKTKQEATGLPEPVALTPEQLKEIVTTAAGGLLPGQPIIRIGIPAASLLA
jgi:hypothetical protein